MRNRNHIHLKTSQRESVFPESDYRVRVLMVMLVCIALVLIVRLYILQVVQYDKWVALADNQHNASLELMADRGEIYMQDGDGMYPLAVNREYQMLYVVPRDVNEKEHTAIELARILGVDAMMVTEKLNKPNDPFEIIKKRLTDDEIQQIKTSGLIGVGLFPEKYRYYPAGELAAKVVGFASLGEEGGAGGYGIEASQNGRLRGEVGTVSQEKDAAGRWIPLSDRDMISPQNGETIVLTLDRVIQYETEKILREATESYQADSVQAIVMDPKTGAILAMAAQPQFDPNQYSSVTDYSIFLNPLVSASYEPGSIMKPITMAIGIEEGKVSPNTEYVDTGVVEKSGYAIRNAENKVYGRSTMTKVLEESINTGVIFVEQLVGNVVFKEYLERFGFGKKTAIGLPAELTGTLRNLKDTRSDIEFFTASFGQGLAVTPIQMTMAYATLANGGVLYEPQIMKSILHTDGSEEKIPPREVRRVVHEDTSRAIGTMLENVVLRGHGKRAQVSGYRVGGKTGTAQVAKKDAKGYEEGLSIGSFVGYAPLDDPRFVVLVKIDNPKNVEWAESSAAPTFGRIMKFLLEYAKIPPTEDVVVKQ